MIRVQEKESDFSEKDLDFERERLLNLISSKISRKDFDIAQNLAGDLYDVEVAFALRRKIRKLIRFNRIVLLLIILTLPVIIASMTFAVLGHRPFFYIEVLAAAILVIVAFILLNAMLVRHFGKTRSMILEAYDVRKRNFVGFLTRHYCKEQDPGREFSMTAIKREIHQWLAIKM